MSSDHDHLERLITRRLDNECTPQQRAWLDELLARDPAAAALFDSYRRLDQQVGDALRSELARPLDRSAGPVINVRRTAWLAAAACLALLLWLAPEGRQPARPGATPTRASSAGSWFAPPPAGDTYVEQAELAQGVAERPAETRWIVVPSGRPGEFLVIEVNRVIPKRAARLARDF